MYFFKCLNSREVDNSSVHNEPDFGQKTFVPFVEVGSWESPLWCWWSDVVDT